MHSVRFLSRNYSVVILMHDHGIMVHDNWFRVSLLDRYFSIWSPGCAWISLANQGVLSTFTISDGISSTHKTQLMSHNFSENFFVFISYATHFHILYDGSYPYYNLVFYVLRRKKSRNPVCLICLIYHVLKYPSYEWSTAPLCSWHYVDTR